VKAPVVAVVEDPRPVTDFDLESFRIQLSVMLRQHMEIEFPSLDVEDVTVQRGRKYARIVQGTSVYCFVDVRSGDILKAESWKKPAKHSRGSIFNQDALECCGPYGVAYLK